LESRTDWNRAVGRRRRDYHYAGRTPVKVKAEETPEGRTLREDDVPALLYAYAVSKREAEWSSEAFARATGMQAVIIIRPPLAYGLGMKRNLTAVIQWIQKGFPIP